MVRTGEEGRATIVGKIEFQNETDKALLLYTMRLFKDAVEFAHNLFRKDLPKNEIVKLLTSRILHNKWYSVSAYIRAKLYENQSYLKLKKPQLYSAGSSDENGNRNIKFVRTDLVKIKIPSADGKHRWIECKVKFGRKHIPIIEELLRGGQTYGAGVSLSDDGKYVLYVNVPRKLYVERMKKKIKTNAKARLFAGFDFNPDRINMVIVDKKGQIREARNEHFHEVTSHGFPREKAKAIRREALARLVKYAKEHGVKYFVVERLEKPKTKTKSKSANRKITKFAVREYLEQMRILVEKVGGKIIEVDPAYTSIDAIPLAKKLGIDRHTASAYLIALRGLMLLKNHKNT